MSEITTDRRATDRGTPDRRRSAREPFVEFIDVHKAYGVKQVLRGATLTVHRGEVLVILGGSGTGKSLKISVGENRPSALLACKNGLGPAAIGPAPSGSQLVSFRLLG